MARIAHHDITPTLDAARIWREKCLLANGSVFSESVVWTIENLKDLEIRVVQNYLGDGRPFYEKLNEQLKGARKEVIYLTAEMLWFMFLFPSKMSATTKRDDIRKVWSWSGEELSEDNMLLRLAMERDIGFPGTAYNTHRPRELAYLIQLVVAWKQLEEEARERLIKDPWAFGTWIDNVEGSDNRLLRHILLYLIFPDYYERIASRKHKRRLIAAFANVLGNYVKDERLKEDSQTAIDHKIYHIRLQMEAQHTGRKLDFYLPPLSEKWQGGDADEEHDRNDQVNTDVGIGRRYWIEKTHVAGRPGREHGDHALGKALWSPQRSTNGRDIYKSMREVAPNDIIYHLIDNKAISGVSVTDSLYDDSFVGLAGTDWENQKGYRISLSKYESLEPGLDRTWLFENGKYAERLKALLSRYRNLFYSSTLELNQGAYLTEAPKDLVNIMNEAYREHTGRNLPYYWNGDSVSVTHDVDKPAGAVLEPATTHIPLPKPFLLLAGISGTGKTRFVREQAKICADFYGMAEGDIYCLVPARPDWHEPSDLLGYISRIGSDGPRYVVTDLLRFIVAAWKHATDSATASQIIYKQLHIVCPFWLCLDEMNLAPVEQYFADYLSILETRRWDAGAYSCEPLLKAAVIQQQLDVFGRKDLWEKLNIDGDDPLSVGLRANFSTGGIPIPPNLIVAGTVNMDETTHGFSRKVIDRALTIDFGEFFPNDYDQFFVPVNRPKVFGFPILSQITPSDLSSVSADSEGLKTIGFLKSINGILKDTPFELAYRALNEVLLSLVCFKPTDDIALQAVWDDFLMMKVLPRIEGDAEKLSYDGEVSLLTKLADTLKDKLSDIWATEAGRPDLLSERAADGSTVMTFCRSKKKLEWMQNRLAGNSFTTFWP
jgi:hypothetical protein